MIVAALLLQAAAAAPGPILPARACSATADTGEVVVCGRRGDSPYRLRPLPPPPGNPPRDPLGFALPGGGQGKVHAIQTDLPGASGKGMAVTLRMPFERKPKR